MRKYPRIMVPETHIKTKQPCDICKRFPPANTRIYVQINEFRGDDDVYYVHEKCLPRTHVELLKALGY